MLLVVVLLLLIECNEVDEDEVVKMGTGTLVVGGGDRPCMEALEYLRVSEVLRGNGCVSTGDVFG